MDAPKHAFELTIHLGAVDEKAVSDMLYDLSYKFSSEGVRAMVSGGWNGSYDIQVERRDVTPEQYREELKDWREWRIAEDEKIKEQSQEGGE